MSYQNELFNLISQSRELEAIIDENGITDEAVLDAIEQHEYDLEAEGEKLIALRKDISMRAKNARAIAREYRKEADRFSNEAKRQELREETLMNRIKETMKAMGRKVIPAGIYEFFLRKNGGKAALKIDGEVPIEYCKVEPDNDKIRDYLETLPEDIICPWAHLERGEHVEIRAGG